MSYILESCETKVFFFLCGLILETEEILVVTLTNQQNDNMSVKICNELHC